ncbi:AEC family transporter [Vogesella sp. GCM10023246]|uniref:AEC family transporter n=1 Tax=Vogesella oryzagri TaxID=3160864 RepID=A0ABV1M4Y1_9NEIS
MLDILAVIAPIFLLIGLGYLAVRGGAFPQDKLAALGVLVARFALPALILHSLSTRSPTEMLNGHYLAAYAVGSLTMLALGIGWAMLARKQPLPRAALYGLGMSCSNSAFVGYPIVHQLLGPVATLALALSMVVENLLMLPLGIALSEADGSRRERFWHAFGRSLLGLRSNPIIVAIVAGVLLAMLDLQLPAVLAKPVAMLGAASAPVALFLIGGSLVGLPLRSVLRDVSVVAGSKLLLHPLLVAGALLLFAPVQPQLAMAGVLIAAMPMLSIFPIFGQRHGMQGFCAATLLLATMSSFITISLAIWLLQRYPLG